MKTDSSYFRLKFQVFLRKKHEDYYNGSTQYRKTKANKKGNVFAINSFAFTIIAVIDVWIFGAAVASVIVAVLVVSFIVAKTISNP